MIHCGLFTKTDLLSIRVTKQKTFSNDRTAFELRNMLWTWAPFFRRILQVDMYGGWGGRGEHAGISWHAYKYSHFAQRTQLRVHMWDNNNYRTTQLERFHSFPVGSPSPPTHPLDLSSLTFCTFTHKWQSWNWLLTIHGHSEPAPTRAPPTSCPLQNWAYCWWLVEGLGSDQCWAVLTFLENRQFWFFMPLCENRVGSWFF